MLRRSVSSSSDVRYDRARCCSVVAPPWNKCAIFGCIHLIFFHSSSSIIAFQHWLLPYRTVLYRSTTNSVAATGAVANTRSRFSLAFFTRDKGTATIKTERDQIRFRNSYVLTNTFWKMSGQSDSEKLLQAFQELIDAFGSWNNILEAFGLLNMPTAQRYGIVFGCITFIVTVSTVIGLLTFGGSFKRIAEQAQDDVTIPHAHTARAGRALLLERLLDARERMLQYYPSPQIVSEGFSSLTKLLLNDHKQAGAQEFPEGYQNNYEVAYRKCQDAPGGTPCEIFSFSCAFCRVCLHYCKLIEFCFHTERSGYTRPPRVEI